MILVNLAYSTDISVKELLQTLPNEALVDTAFAAAALGTTVDALVQRRRNGTGARAVHLPCRKTRYYVGDLRRFIQVRDNAAEEHRAAA